MRMQTCGKAKSIIEDKWKTSPDRARRMLLGRLFDLFGQMIYFAMFERSQFSGQVCYAQ